MAGFTNRGKKMILDYCFARTARPTKFYVALVTSAAAPTADTNIMSDLTQIATGNGYTDGGYELTPGSTDFDASDENDTSDYGYIQLKDVAWTASAGSIPASGNGARYAVITDDNGTIGSRIVLAYWDLTSDRSVSAGQTLTLQNCELRLTES